MSQLQNDNIFFDVQKQVVNILNSEPELSSVCFFAENEKDIENDITKALRKQGICGVVQVEDASFQGFDSGIDTAWQIDNLVVQVVENVVVNRASNNNSFVGTAEDVGAKVSQVLGGAEYGRQDIFSLKQIEIGEDNGLIVCKVSFRCLITTDISSIVPPPVTPGDKKQIVFLDYLSSNYYDKTETNGRISASIPSLSGCVPKDLSSDTIIETHSHDLIVRDSGTGSITTYSGSGGYWTIDGAQNGVDYLHGAYNSFQQGSGIQLFGGSYIVADASSSITIEDSRYVSIDNKSLSSYIAGITVENANNANFASGAGTAQVAIEASHASTADTALTAETANYANSAENANYANFANGATTADTALTADIAQNANEASHALTSDYALTAENANYATNSHNAEWAQDIDESTSTTLSTYAKKSYVDGLIGTLAQTISEI